MAFLAPALPFLTAAASVAGAGVAIDQQQKGHLASEDAKKIAAKNEANQQALIQEQQNKTAAARASMGTAQQLADQRRRQGMSSLSSRYSGGDGTATLLGGSGAPVSQGGKTLLGM